MKDKEQIVNECLTKLIAACALEKMKRVVAQNEDKWITVKPNGEENKGKHLLIKDGESVEDAMHRNGWYSKRQAKQGKKSQKTSKQQNNAKIVNSINSFLKQSNFDFKDFNNERLEDLNKALNDISQKYKFEKLESINSDNTLDAYANADAEEINIRQDFCNADKKQLKSYYDEEITTYKDDVKNAINNANLGISQGYNYYKNQLKTLKQMDKFERFGVHSDSPDDYFIETIVHELGHVISKQKILEEVYKNHTTKNYDLMESTYKQAIKNKDIYKISYVAYENFQEFFAEVFVQYYINEPMPQYIKDMIEKLLEND